MNAPAEADTAQVSGRGNRGRRGRGGSRSANSAATKKVAAKAAVSKIGPSRVLDIDWAKDPVLKENSFVLWLGSGAAGDQQWTFHHPIGKTSLDFGDWVSTPTRDLNYLLMRRESEELSAYRRQAELAKRRAVLSAGTRGRGLDDQTEVWLFENAPAIQPTIQTCMAAAKAAGAPESAWLDYADRAVQAAERTFKEALRHAQVPPEWTQDNPEPLFETRGGPLGDRPQKAIPYLKGLSLSAAKDKVVRRAIGFDQSEDDSSSDEDVEEEVPAPRAGSSQSQKAKPSGPKSV